MRKTIVLDSNIPMLDPLCLENFEDNDVIAPSTVVKELNKNKTKKGPAGKNARDFTNLLDSFEEEIYDGVKLESGGTLKVVPTFPNIAKEIEAVFHELEADEYIISVAIHLQRLYETEKAELEESLKHATEEEKLELEEKLAALQPVVFVSRDTNCRIKARKFGVKAETYFSDHIQVTDLYKGYRLLEVSDDVLNQYVSQKNKLEGDGREEYQIFHPELRLALKEHNFYDNEYIILLQEGFDVNDEKALENLFKTPNAPVVRHRNGNFYGLLSFRLLLSKYNIFPRNLHQTILVDMIADPNTKQKSIIGLAGSGKTLFALLVSIILTNDLNIYDEIIITRPPVEAEYQLGYLPGNEEEKMNPYLRGFQGNLKFIVNQLEKNKHKSVKAKEKEREKDQSRDNGRNKDSEKDKEKEKSKYDFANFNIRTESMGFMRGETTYRQIIIIDESQNSTSRAMKTALTRIGDESLIIILGDITQIDYHLVDATSNGLTHAVELMKDDDLAAHITLPIGERSDLSKRIAEKWDKFGHKKPA